MRALQRHRAARDGNVSVRRVRLHDVPIGLGRLRRRSNERLRSGPRERGNLPGVQPCVHRRSALHAHRLRVRLHVSPDQVRYVVQRPFDGPTRVQHVQQRVRGGARRNAELRGRHVHEIVRQRLRNLLGRVQTHRRRSHGVREQLHKVRGATLWRRNVHERRLRKHVRTWFRHVRLLHEPGHR
jgi:hypothetical protein